MRNSRRISSIIGLDLGLILALGTTASAATSAPTDPKPNQRTGDTMSVASSSETESKTDATAAALANNELTIRAPKSALKTSETAVYTMKSDEASFTSVTVPIGDDYSMSSNLTFLFDEDGNIVQYGEMLVSER